MRRSLPPRRTPSTPRGLVLAIVLLAAVPAVPARAPAQGSAKKPLTPAAFDGWRSIHDVTLSDDGRWAVYSLVPQVGDGEVVVRDLRSGVEHRHTRGFIGRPQTKAGASRQDAISFPPARITSDGRFVIFTIEPERAEWERARRERRRAQAQPKTALGIMSTATGEVTVIPNVRSFRLAEESGRYVAYLLAPPDSGAARAARDSGKAGGGAAAAAAVPGGEPRPVADSTSRARKEYGSTLVLRELATGSEERTEDVTAYAFDRRGAWLGYTVSSRAAERDGAYVRSLTDGRTVALLSGRGSYRALTFDSAGTQVVFVSDRDEQARAKPRFTLYHAALVPVRSRGRPRAGAAGPSPATPLVTPALLGDSLIVAPNARLTFSADGRTLALGVAPPPLDSIPADSLADKAVFDLWHWKDDRLQPEQRVEARRDRERWFTAAYRLDTHTLRILGSDSLPRVELSANGRTALGTTDVPYRIQAMWGEGGSDIYVLDVITGSRTLVARRVPFGATLSPEGRYVLYFDRDHHWHAYAVATGRTTNLTQPIAGVRFDQETWDTPSDPAPWGVGGWTRGDRSVLLYDRYDIWEVDPSLAQPARVVTDSVGRRQHLIFRVAEVDTGDAPIDPAQPLLLRATDDSSKASGFWRDRIDRTTPPVSLLMADRRMGELHKAKHAPVYLFTQSSFQEFPNLWVTNEEFASPVRISDANPQQREYKWGTAQLVSWRSADGVPLRGILFKPEDFDPRKKYPMVVYFYEQLSDNLHAYVPPAGRNVINPTVYVSNDYLVFEPDIHYEIGYPGPSALKSIVPGVQMLIDSGFVNPDAVGIQGQSWGGYQTAYIITRTSLFKAAMAGAPVANMTSAYGGIRWQTGLSRTFQYEHTQSRIGGSLWEYPMRYLENSPLFAADRVTTPLLIMANDNDGAVPWYQGIELFIALRRLGKEVYLIDYNGEEHNPTKRANQLDIAMRMQQFFDHHLKGAPAPDWMRRGIPFLEKGRDQLAGSASVATAPTGGTPPEPRER